VAITPSTLSNLLHNDSGAIRLIFLGEGTISSSDDGPLFTRGRFVDSPTPAPVVVPPTSIPQPQGPVSLGPTTALDPLLIPVGYVNPVSVAIAPMPREIGEISPAQLEVAPPPREVPAPPAKDANPVSLTQPAQSDAFKVTAAPIVVAAGEVVDTHAAVEEAAEPRPAARVSWGWFGALAAAISAGGYWVLHHSERTSRGKLNVREHRF
jgi:hypothetical protein